MGTKISKLEKVNQRSVLHSQNQNNLDIISHEVFGTMAVFNKAKATQFQGEIQIMNMYDMQLQLGDMHMAQNSTFIIEHKLENKISLTHCSARGEFLKNIAFENCQLQIQMMTENKCLILARSEQNKIAQVYLWNISNNNIIKYGCWKIHHKKTKVSLFVFPNTSLFCVYLINQVGNNSTVSLIYYKYENQTPVCTEYINVKGRPSEVGVKKLDNSSLIGIYESVYIYKEDSTIKLMLTSLSNLNKQKERPICKKQVIQMSYQFIKNPQSGIFVRITDIWRISEGVLYICLEALERNQNQMINKFKTSTFCAPQIKQNKIYSFIWKYQKGIYKPMKLQVDQDHLIQFIGENRTKKHYKFEQKLPIYYVDKITDKKSNTHEIELMAMQMKMPKEGQLLHRSVPAFNPKMELIYYEDQTIQNIKGNQGQLEIKKKKIKYLIREIQRTYQFKYSEVLAFWMTSMIKNCDQALLQSVSNLLIQ